MCIRDRYYQMAQIVVTNGDLKHGKQYVIKALSIDQENIWYLTMLAGFYYQEKNLDSAIIYYEKAVKYFPEKENLLSLIHISEPTRLLSISYAVFCLKKKKK